MIAMAKQYNKSSEKNSEAFSQLTGIEGTVPPQAVELEQAVLGALLLEKDAIIDVQEYVKEETFYTEEHRLIFRAIQELSFEMKAIDLYTVTERLKSQKLLTKVGGAAYLAQLTQRVASAAHIEVCAARADTLGNRDSASLLRRGDRRNRAYRLCRAGDIPRLGG